MNDPEAPVDATGPASGTASAVTVRRAGPGDEERLASVAAVTFGLACPPHTSEEAKADFIATQLSAERFAGYLADPTRALFLAEDSAGPLGYTMLVDDEPSDPEVLAAVTIRPTIELSKCYVLADRHGAGVAAALMAASLEFARGTGAAGAWLGVNEENGRAQRFYAKHGFERVGTKHFLVGGRLEDDWVMQRALR